MLSLANKFKSVYRNEFIRNVLTLMTGSALGQGLALLLSPVLTRLFTPEDFSAFEQYALLLSVFTVVITGRYEFAILHPDDKEDARHIAALAMRTALKICGVMLLVLLILPGTIASFLHQQELKWWLWTLPFALFAIAIFNTTNFWFSREKEFKVAATSKMLYSFTGEPVKLATGFLNTGTAGLIIGTLAGHFIAAWYSWKKFVASESKRFTNLSKAKLKSLASEHADYPRYAVWGGILNNLAQWAHVAIFTVFYGEKAIIPIGMIALSRRIFFNPLGILSTSYGQVFYQKISEIKSAVMLRNFYLSNLFRFLIFSGVLVFMVQILPDDSLGIIFGEAWTGALPYLQVLSYWYALNFVIGTLSFIFYRLQLQWLTLAADIFHFVIVIVAFWFARYTQQDEMGAIRMMVIAKVLYLILNGLVVIAFLQRNCRLEKLNQS